MNINKSDNVEGPIGHIYKKIYIDDDTGKIKMIKGEETDGKEINMTGEISSAAIDSISSLGHIPYTYWMLSLTENFKWKEDIHTFKPSEDITLEFEVIGIEKEQNRQCFKVKTRYISNGNIEINSLLWIDKEERILIKGVLYNKNLPIIEVRKIN